MHGLAAARLNTWVWVGVLPLLVGGSEMKAVCGSRRGEHTPTVRAAPACSLRPVVFIERLLVTF